MIERNSLRRAVVSNLIVFCIVMGSFSSSGGADSCCQSSKYPYTTVYYDDTTDPLNVFVGARTTVHCLAAGNNPCKFKLDWNVLMDPGGTPNLPSASSSGSFTFTQPCNTQAINQDWGLLGSVPSPGGTHTYHFSAIIYSTVPCDMPIWVLQSTDSITQDLSFG